MTDARKKIAVGLMLVVLSLGVTYAWSSVPSSANWDQGYYLIKVGDDEQRVAEILGKPTEIKDCFRPSYSGNDEIWYKCAEEHWYVAFMQEWVYVIGKDGKVIAKWHSVSP